MWARASRYILYTNTRRIRNVYIIYYFLNRKSTYSNMKISHKYTRSNTIETLTMNLFAYVRLYADAEMQQ